MYIHYQLFYYMTPRSCTYQEGTIDCNYAAIKELTIISRHWVEGGGGTCPPPPPPVPTTPNTYATYVLIWKCQNRDLGIELSVDVTGPTQICRHANSHSLGVRLTTHLTLKSCINSMESHSFYAKLLIHTSIQGIYGKFY